MRFRNRVPCKAGRNVYVYMGKNSRTSDNIDMKLGPVTKPDNRNTLT